MSEVPPYAGGVTPLPRAILNLVKINYLNSLIKID